MAVGALETSLTALLRHPSRITSILSAHDHFVNLLTTPNRTTKSVTYIVVRPHRATAARTPHSAVVIHHHISKTSEGSHHRSIQTAISTTDAHPPHLLRLVYLLLAHLLAKLLVLKVLLLRKAEVQHVHQPHRNYRRRRLPGELLPAVLADVDATITHRKWRHWVYLF